MRLTVIIIFGHRTPQVNKKHIIYKYMTGYYPSTKERKVIKMCRWRLVLSYNSMKWKISHWCCWWPSSNITMMHSDDCSGNLLMVSHHWFRYGWGPSGTSNITWANVDTILWFQKWVSLHIACNMLQYLRRPRYVLAYLEILSTNQWNRVYAPNEWPWQISEYRNYKGKITSDWAW